MDIKAQASFFSGNIDEAEWQPFEYPQEGKLETYGEVVPFREAGSGGKLLAVGLWRCLTLGDSPMYCSELGDEAFLVLEGEVEITVLETGEKFHYREGDVGSWSQGTKTVWNIKQAFKKFYVVAAP